MLHLDVNRSGRKTDSLLTCSVERKTKWCHISTPKYTFIACVVMTSLYALRHYLQLALCDIPTPDILLTCGGDLHCGLLRCDVQYGTHTSKYQAARRHIPRVMVNDARNLYVTWYCLCCDMKYYR